MILKGNQRAGGSQLAAHLMNVRDNDHVSVHELRGFISDDLPGAFNEAYAVSRGTKCRQFLFSLSLNPPETEVVPIGAFEDAIASIEQRLGLSDQPRAMIFHEKNGRRHAHCVWSRIDVAEMKAINLPHYKMKLRDISRELYLEHQWEMPRGLVNSDEHDPLNFTLEEWQQALRVQTDPKELKKAFIDCWEASDSMASFDAALNGHGLHLARGDRRGYVAVDGRGEIHSLSRWTSKKTQELKARLGLPDQLRTIEETRKLIAQRLSETANKVQTAANKRKTNNLAAYKAHRHALVLKQREARTELLERQRNRAVAERTERQGRLPRGLKALWFRITGAYQKFQKRCEQEAVACDRRDQSELADLVRRQLAERRELKLRTRQEDQRYAQQLEVAFAEIKARQSQLLDAPTPPRREARKRKRSLMISRE